MKYKKEIANKDGWCDWIQPVKKGYRIACCDCGLVHNMDFRILNGRVQFKVSRNNRATGALRRHSGIKIEHGTK